MKKIQLVALLGLFTVAFAFAGGGSEEKTQLTFAGSEAVGSLGDRMGEKFAEYINEKGTSLEVVYVKGDTLGSIQDVIKQLMQDSLDVAFIRPQWYTTYVNDFQILTWGFTFRDGEHLDSFYNSDIFAEWKDEVSDTMGVTILGAGVDQPRILFAKNPVPDAEAIKGLKIRVPAIKSYIETWKGLGALPTQIAWAEAFLGLQTGVVDAAEADVSGAMSQRFHIAAPYIMRTEHEFSGYTFAINNNKLSTLTDDQKKLVQEATDYALSWMTEQAKIESEAVLDQMVSEGATIVPIDKGPVQKSLLDASKQMEAEGLWNKGLWEKIQNL